ncbi:MAG: MBOAT family protein [Lachnospiraceae bacterium]|nr:MBOAT family protein [Lachnospiraceae bacterium]
MIFYSLKFVVFMAAVFLIYWNIPHRYRWALILAANICFYACYDLRYLIVLVLITVISFFTALYLEDKPLSKKRKGLFVMGLLMTLSFLFVFKYLNFTFYGVRKVLSFISIPIQETTLKLIMPAGISFYTFETAGYLIDVYMGKIKAVRHFGKYAVFVSFFPNISSGPIERAGHFIPQLDEEKVFDYGKAVYGSRLLLFGLLKKIIFADMMVKYVDAVFDNVTQMRGICFAWATLLYTFQIYFDFSGYSDMAVGLAKLLGFDLLTNFKSPYMSSSIKEFWGSWHISLSTWFRDYVYIPLGGNRCSKLKRDRNLLLTFLASGLWHGASFTFIFWGGIHGVCQIIENRISEAVSALKKDKAGATGQKPSGNAVYGEKEGAKAVAVKILQTVLTFLIVSYAWLFFRANSISEALYATKNMFADLSVATAMANMKMSDRSVLKTTLAIVFILVYDFFAKKRDLLKEMDRLKTPLRWVIYVAAGVLVVAFASHSGGAQEFIYFKF